MKEIKENNKKFLEIKTICHQKIQIEINKLTSILNLKKEILLNTNYNEEDILLISQGKKLEDTLQIITENKKKNKDIYVIVKPSTNKLIKVQIKINNPHSPSSSSSSSSSSSNSHSYSHNNQEVITKVFPANIRISELKKKLYELKECSIIPLEQRAICSSRLMRDSNILGDYLLGYHHNHKNSNKNNKKQNENENEPMLTIYISRTMNLNRDLTIHLKLPSSKQVSFPFQFCDSLYYIREILDKQFGLPIPEDNSLGLYFQHGSMKLQLDHNLYDYGIYPPIKSVSLEIRRVPTISNGMIAIPISQLIRSNSFGYQNGPILRAIEDASTSSTITSSSSSSLNSSQKSDESKFFSGMKVGFLPTKLITKPLSTSNSTSNSSSSSSPSITSSTTISNKKTTKKSDKMFSGMKKGFLSSTSSMNRTKTSSHLVNMNSNVNIKNNIKNNVAIDIISDSGISNQLETLDSTNQNINSLTTLNDSGENMNVSAVTLPIATKATATATTPIKDLPPKHLTSP